ncbi:MAG: hypothetical protein Q9159_002163 [Coniocarpon cinnabarinum]
MSPYGGHGPELLGVSWAFMGLATVLLSLRIVVKIKLVKGVALRTLIWAWSGWLFAVTANCFLTVAISNGFGNHMEMVEKAGTITPVIALQWTSDATIGLAIGVGKFSVVSFFMDIQGPAYRKAQRLLVILVAINLARNVITLFLIFFQCSPPRALWDISINGDCSGFQAAYYFGIAGGYLVLAIYPVGIVYKLQMARKLKLGICVLLGVGFFTCVCSIMKTYSYKSFSSITDTTYDIAPLQLWGVAEMWVVPQYDIAGPVNSDTLQAEGVSAHCPQLPTSDLRLMNIGDIQNPDYDRAIPENGYPAPADDVAIVAALLSRLILENHEHVLLVGHSSGALVATQAATPALQSQNLRKSGKQGGIIGLFYVSGVLVPVGESLHSFTKPQDGREVVCPPFARFHVRHRPQEAFLKVSI